MAKLTFYQNPVIQADVNTMLRIQEIAKEHPFDIRRAIARDPQIRDNAELKPIYQAALRLACAREGHRYVTGSNLRTCIQCGLVETNPT